LKERERRNGSEISIRNIYAYDDHSLQIDSFISNVEQDTRYSNIRFVLDSFSIAFSFLFLKRIAMTTVEHETTSVTGSAVAHTAVAENVAVKSVVSTKTQSKVSLENAEKMATLMSKLGK
jgi:hypothetical protein